MCPARRRGLSVKALASSTPCPRAPDSAAPAIHAWSRNRLRSDQASSTSTVTGVTPELTRAISGVENTSTSVGEASVNAQSVRTPSRRAVVRAAAWTAPAVSIVVAAPAFATTSPGAISGTATSIQAGRNIRDKLVRWTLTFKNTGTQAITDLGVTFSGVTGVTSDGLAVTSGGLAWTGGGTATRSYPSAVASGDTITLVAVFTRGENEAGTATASFAASSPSVVVATSSASYAPKLGV